MTELSGADDAGAGDRPPETLTDAARLAYGAVFEAITDGWNRKAALRLRDLDPAQLDELAAIGGDVRTLAEAERRRRGGPEPAVPQDGGRERDVLDDIDDAVAGITDDEIEDSLRETLRRAGYTTSPQAVRDFAAACERADTDPREQRRIQGITDLIEAEDIIYAQALAALERGDRDTAIGLLRWCARAGIGESAWFLAGALEAAGEHAEADTWYARAAADGDMRAAAVVRINAGSLGTPAARRIRARADKDAVDEVLRRVRENEEACERTDGRDINDDIAGPEDARDRCLRRRASRLQQAGGGAVRDYGAAQGRVG